MDELSLYEKILCISSPWNVSSIQLDEPDNCVHVYVDFDRDTPLQCPLCELDCSRHDTRKRTWRHLDSCQFKTLVHTEIPRTKCEKHGVLQVDVPWATDRSRFTLMFESLVINWLKETSINAVARRFDMSWNAIDGIMKRAVIRGLESRNNLDLKHLSVDEVCSRKGREYVTIVSNKNGQVLDVQEGKSSMSLNAFYHSLNTKNINAIKTVSMDMGTAFISSTKSNLPQWKSAICFDKFHVAKDLNKAVNEVRIDDWRIATNEVRAELNRSKFTWMRSKATLQEKHELQMQALWETAKNTARAWTHKQSAMDLWNFDDKVLAEEAWGIWYTSAIQCQLMPIKTAAKSIMKNLWGIINAIVHKRDNGRAESINSQIKMLKVKAKGFRNKERFKTSILFHLGGLDLFPKKSST